MKVPPKALKIVGIGLAILLASVLIVRTWVIPAVIARQLEARYAGKVKVGGWWLGGRSAGIKGLELFEGDGGGGEPWARVDSVETDLSLGQILRGGTTPGTITLHGPKLTFALDEAGRPTTRIPIKGRRGRLGTDPEDRDRRRDRDDRAGRGASRWSSPKSAPTWPPSGDGEALNAEAKDPTWGNWKVVGDFGQGFQTGEIALSSVGVRADAKKVRAIPFIPKEVWDNIEPTGAGGRPDRRGAGDRDGLAGDGPHRRRPEGDDRPASRPWT